MRGQTISICLEKGDARMRHMRILCGLGGLVAALWACPVEAAETCVTQTAGETSTTLTWQNTDTTDPVVVERTLTSGGPYTVIATTTPGVLTYTDAGLPVGATYYYVVYNKSTTLGNSAISNEACKTIGNPPVAPTNLQAK